jgi:LCP family protein required for cell wall assembly
VGLVLTVVAAAVVVHRFGVFPPSWIVIGAVLTAIATALIAVFLWRTKAPPSWFRFIALALVAVLGMAGAAEGIKASVRVEDFVEKARPVPTSAEYSVIALKTHSAKSASLQDESLGELAEDPKRTEVETLLKNKFNSSFVVAADAGDIATGLQAGRFDAAVLDSNFVASYAEGDPEFFESIQVIYTFNVTGAEIPVVEEAEPVEPGDSFVVYISGIDTSGPISRISRSDVNILMVVNPTQGKVLLVNTPRDYYVQLHGTSGTKDKLTHAGIYGVRKSIDTLQDLYGVNIDYYARVNFSSLIKIVDTVGGIDVDSPAAFSGGQFSFTMGTNHLNGEQALAFSRERHAFTAGDRMRGKNQQLVISALIKKASQPSNLLRYDQMLKSLEGAVEMNVPMETITNVVKQRLADSKEWQVESVSVDGQGSSQPTYSMGSMKLYVMIPDQATIDNATSRIKATMAP